MLRLRAGPWSHHQLCALAWEDPPLCFKGVGTDVAGDEQLFIISSAVSVGGY